MIDVSSFPTVLRLRPTDSHCYEDPGGRDDEPRNVVFGGQILAQMLVAAHLDRSTETENTKDVKSIHAIFARAGDYTKPIEYTVESLHDGRALGSDTVTFAQEGRVMSRGLVLWSADEPDLMRHLEHVEMPAVAEPEELAPAERPMVFPGAEARVVDDVDVWSEDQPVGPALQHVWTRFGETHPQVIDQAILAWATDGWLIGTAMLPHQHVWQDQAHRTISTGVVSHTLSFHERFEGDEWLLLANESIWAGRGRTHGRCNVWSRDGRLVATYTQDNLVRSFADNRDHTADYRRIM